MARYHTTLKWHGGSCGNSSGKQALFYLGVPKRFPTNQGTQSESELFRQLCELWEVAKMATEFRQLVDYAVDSLLGVI